MLVVSRKLGERIKIGDEIEVVVVKIDRNQIRLGVAAPRDVEVYRHEIAPPGRRTSAKRTKKSDAAAREGDDRADVPASPGDGSSSLAGEPTLRTPILSPDPAV